MKMKKILIRLAKVIGVLVVLVAVTVLVLNLIVKSSAGKYILSEEDALSLEDVDCVLVLGCKVHGDGTPSAMLHDRLQVGVGLYLEGAAPKLIMSGDHGRDSYDEVETMKLFAMEQGAKSSDVFMDHAGFSTYESMYRARDVFQAKKIIIVTQGYHLYRAVYIARRLGLDAYGVASDLRGYSGQGGRDFREVLARVKDFFTCVFRPEPTYLGEAIPVWGDGDLTNDEKWNLREGVSHEYSGGRVFL